MCGRFTQSDRDLPGFPVVNLVELLEGRTGTPYPPVRYNGAPGQDFRVIRRHPESGEYQCSRLTWGLIPFWVKDVRGGRKPINAKGETIAALPSFRAAYAKRRCLVPINSFFEWQKIKGPKQPYAIAMKSGEPFALAGIWEGWRHPETEEVMRTFCIITTDANELIAQIHHRMPVIIAPDAYHRWLSPQEPDLHELLVPYPAEPMTMWPVSVRVNSPANDDAAILEGLPAASPG
jgi:putative SOS response-associated peptidase YedK